MLAFAFDKDGVEHDRETDAAEADQRGPSELLGPGENEGDDVLGEIRHVLEADLQAHETISPWMVVKRKLKLLELAQIERPEPYPRGSHTAEEQGRAPCGAVSCRRHRDEEGGEDGSEAQRFRGYAPCTRPNQADPFLKDRHEHCPEETSDDADTL